jgi:CspA family cold shock protein
MIDSPISDFLFNFSSILLDLERFADGFRFIKYGQKVSFELVENPNSTVQG